MPINSDVKPTLLTLQRFNDSKRRRVVLICLLLSTLILLTIGLQNISLQAPAPVNFEQQNGDTSYHLVALKADRAFIIAAFILLLVLLLLVVTHMDRKWGIILLVSSSLIAFAFYLSSTTPIKENSKPVQNVGTPVAEQVDSPTAQSAGDFSVAEFHPPQFSNLLLLFISFAVVLFFVFIIWMIYLWRRSQPPVMHIQSLGEIGEAARIAMEDLAAGMDERDAVIRCYSRMNEIVMRSHHMERGASRTATEFALKLEAVGLPGDSVRKLTHLFEAVRYGTYASRQLEIEEAKECLAEIAQYCGESV